jgi:hypothetical protein
MFDLLGGGVIGSMLGGLFRFAPEVLKWLDKKNERQHELSMFERQVDLEKTRGQQRMAEIGAERDLSVDTGVMAAFKSAIDQQTEMVKVAGGFIASLSASVRPVMTYYVLALYGLVKIGTIYILVMAGTPGTDLLAKMWGPDDMALLCGVVNYWIMDRTLAKRGL